MQFCEPNMLNAFEKFRQTGVDRVVLVPMFPQYASSSTGSAIEIAYKAAAKVRRMAIHETQIKPSENFNEKSP